MTRPRREVSDLEWRMARADAERARCPWCGAESGAHCVNPFGDDLKAPAHWQRLAAARNLEAS